MMISARDFIWIFTLALALSAGLFDWRFRRIPNWLTLSGLLFGIGLHIQFSGWQGAKFAFEGAGLALLLLFPLVLLRALGAGDWKLMGALGAFLGPVLLLFVLFGSLVVSGLMAIVEIVRTGRVWSTFQNLIVLIRGFFSFGLRKRPEITLDNPGLLKIPFAVAVALATAFCFFVSLRVT
jgi:prepilin peptidase CpaA